MRRNLTPEALRELMKELACFARDLDDAEQFLQAGLVDPERCRALVREIPKQAYARYPALTRTAVQSAVDDFLASRRPGR